MADNTDLDVLPNEGVYFDALALEYQMHFLLGNLERRLKRVLGEKVNTIWEGIVLRGVVVCSLTSYS